MNGLTATGVTVGICAGLWQLVSSHVGLSQGWELLGTIGFVAFCSLYAAGGGKTGFIRSLADVYKRQGENSQQGIVIGEIVQITECQKLVAAPGKANEQHHNQ